MDKINTNSKGEIAVIMGNLEDLSKRWRALAVSRFSQCHDLWNAVIKTEGYIDTDRMIALISDVFHRYFEPSINGSGEKAFEGIPNLVQKYAFSDIDEAKIQYRAALCILASYELRKRDDFSLEDILGYHDEGGDNAEKSKGCIACVRSEHIENAYQILAEAVDAPKVAYFSSYGDAADALYNGITEYCIIPISNSEEGRLQSFNSLLGKYDFKISAVCNSRSVGKELSLTTEYALLRRDFPASPSAPPELFEISAESDSVLSITEIISVAELMGIKTISINSFMHKRLLIRFNIEECDVTPFLLYLSAFFSDFIPIGLFSTVKNKSKK